MLFPGSADTQLFLINDKKEQSFLISFSGYLNSTTDPLEGFRPSEVILYKGSNVKNIRDTAMQRSADKIENEHHSFRRISLTTKLKEMIIDWIFVADDFVQM